MNVNRQFYRIPQEGKVAGVCAGIAEYFGIETWLVRVLTLTAFFLLAGPFVFVGYIALWFILEKKPDNLYVDTKNVVDIDSSTAKGWYNSDSSRIEIKQKVWQKGKPANAAFNEVKSLFADSERRLRDLESYITSKSFHLDRELNKL